LPNVLSQNEIDKLLNSMQTGEIQPEEKIHDKDKIKKYDFKLANKFTKEQMKALNTVFENFALLLANYFTGTLRVSTEVDVVSIEEQKYYEFTNSLPSSEIFAILNMSPLVGSSLIDISTPFAYSIINRVLGGVMDSENIEPKFTEIELVIMEKIIRKMLLLFDEAWEKVVPVDSYLERIETNPQFAQIVSANETIAIITLNIKIKNVDGFIHFCLPHLAIKPIEKQLSVQYLYSNNNDKTKIETKSDKVEASVQKMSLKLIAKFDTTYASIGDCVNLQVGDVLMMENKVGDPINLYVEHIPKFHGKLGVKGNKYAISITNVIYKEDECDGWDFITS